MNAGHLSALIKSEARELGFDSCGITRPAKFSSQIQYLRHWIDKGYHAGMHYMSKNTNIREDIRQRFPRVQSVVVVLLNYNPRKVQYTQSFRFAKYAYGNDYHEVMTKKLNSLLQIIRVHIPANGVIFTDTGPVFEKQYAVEAGLGWIGKNTLLIAPLFGSYVLIGELFLDVVLEYDHPFNGSRCGDCTRCIDACRSNALSAAYVLDSNRCISYLNKDTDKESAIDFQGFVFGCDICQDVCPFNCECPPHNEPDFYPYPGFIEMSDNEWLSLNSAAFNEYFSHTPAGRMTFRRMQRNIMRCANHF